MLVGAGIDAAAAEFAAHGVDVAQIDSPAYGRAPESHVGALVRFVRERGAGIVLFADTTLAKDIAPALATALGGALVTDVVQLTLGADGALRAVHPVYTGKVNAEFVLGAGTVVGLLDRQGFCLALGVIEPRALVVDGAVEARVAVTLSLTFDHRVADGADGALFAAEIVRRLEQPDRLLLEL